MAFTAKFTAQYGKKDKADIAITAGDAEAQTDTLSINLDVTNMGKREALELLDKAKDAIHAAPWPVN